jgi:Trypsin
LELCCPSEGFSCGMVYPPVAGAPVGNAQLNEAPYGAYPWQAAIMIEPSTFVASGVLIDHFHLVTAAHKVHNYQ